MLKTVNVPKQFEPTEEEFQRFFSLTHDLVCIASTDGYFLKINPAWQEALGYTEQELLAKPYLDLIHPDDRAATMKEVEQQLAGEATMRFINRYRCKDGSYRWLEWSATPAVDGKLLFASARDITERKQADEALLQSEAGLRALVEHSPVAMIVDVGVDADEKVIMMNQKFTRLFGYTMEDLPDVLHWWPLAYPDEKYREEVKAEWIEKVGKAVQSHSDIEPMETTVSCKNGSNRYIRFSLSSIGSRNIITFEDFTESKLAEEKIRKLNEELEAKVQERTKQLLEAQEELVHKEKLALLGQVADTVGHELRNPLGVMNNAVYFLQTVLTDADDTTKEYLGIIKSEIADAERIVSDLLDAVRTKPPHPEMVEVAELIRQTLRKCDIPPSVIVRFDIQEMLPAIQVDPVQMHQVLWNLITNGVEAMPDGGTLEIRADAEPAAHTVTVSIKDSGSGIAPEHQAKLFQPLFTTKTRRIGLGLVVVKNLTQANGGNVAVESAPGKGSVFTVTLPSGGGTIEAGVSL